ncbi:hypothetical protein LTR85_005055 [Meristemomyces frigidus]|nr:hypothetical protein LTR85_005055 [Meristemomyces frigidus]
MSHFGSNNGHNSYRHQPLNPNFVYNPFYPAASYDPRLFGHPHEELATQVTDTFWHQYPEWTQPGYHLYYYPEFNQYFPSPIYSTGDMDTKITYIGKNTNQKAINGDKQKGDGPKFTPRPKPELVEIYIGDTFVRQMKLHTLTRFSSLAAETFPRPKTEVKKAVKAGTEASSDAEEGSASKKWADDKGGKIDLEKATEQVNGLSLTSTGEGETKKSATTDGAGGGKGSKMPATVPVHMAHKGSEAAKSAKKSALPTPPTQKEVLILGDAELLLPDLHAVRMCLEWMIENQGVHGDQRLADFHIADGAPVKALISMYQAALCLGMRPFPRHLEDILKEIVTDSPPTADMLRFAYDRLPECPVLTRIITSSIQHEEKRHYTEEEHKLIQELVAGDDWLNKRFTQITDARIARRRENSGRRRMEAGWAAMEKSLEAEEGGPGPRMPGRAGQPATAMGRVAGPGDGGKRNQRGEKSGEKGKVGAGKDTKGGAVASEPAPAKPKEAKKEGNGRGLGGRHVPGA